MKPRFKVGQQFIPVGRKNKTTYTIKDILTTYNANGEIHSIRYAADYEFCGQIVTDYNIVETTIVRGLI